MNIYLSEKAQYETIMHGSFVPVPWSEHRPASLPNCEERTQRCTHQAKDSSTLRVVSITEDTHINSLLSESGVNRIRSASNCTVLTFEDNPDLQ